MICLPILREFNFAEFRFLCARISFFGFGGKICAKLAPQVNDLNADHEAFFAANFSFFIVIAKSLAVNVSFRHLIL